MRYIKVLLFGRVRQLEFPPAVIATLNTVVTPHQLNGVRLPGLQTENLVCLHLAQLLCMSLKHKTSTSYFFFFTNTSFKRMRTATELHLELGGFCGRQQKLWCGLQKLIFSHVSGVALNVVVGWFVNTPHWPRLKYLNSYWINCHAIIFFSQRRWDVSISATLAAKLPPDTQRHTSPIYIFILL